MSNKSIPNRLALLVHGKEPEYIQYFNEGSTKEIRKLVVRHLHQKIEEASTASEKTSKYEMACWSEYQADHIGYVRAIKEIIKLLDR